MNDKVTKALKILVPVVSLAATMASSFLKEKEFDEKVSKKVAEVLAKNEGES